MATFEDSATTATGTDDSEAESNVDSARGGPGGNGNGTLPHHYNPYLSLPHRPGRQMRFVPPPPTSDSQSDIIAPPARSDADAVDADAPPHERPFSVQSNHSTLRQHRHHHPHYRHHRHPPQHR